MAIDNQSQPVAPSEALPPVDQGREKIRSALADLKAEIEVPGAVSPDIVDPLGKLESLLKENSINQRKELSAEVQGALENFKTQGAPQFGALEAAVEDFIEPAFSETTEGKEAYEALTGVGDQAESQPVAPAEEAKPVEAAAKAEVEAALKKGESGGFLASAATGFAAFGESLSKLFGKIGEGFSKLIDKIKEFFGWKKPEEEKPAEASGSDIDPSWKPDTAPVNPEDLKAVMQEKPDWVENVNEAAGLYDVPPYMVWTVARFESNFDPNATNGQVAGLGQAWGPTWEVFWKQNIVDRLKNDPKDPHSSLHFIAWYLRYLGDKMGVDPHSPGALEKLYVGYHDGETRAQKILNGEGPFEVPAAYKDKTILGVTVNDNWQNYSEMVRRMAKRVSAGGAQYLAILGTESNPNEQLA